VRLFGANSHFANSPDDLLFPASKPMTVRPDNARFEYATSTFIRF
jgi:hypothetical protein